MSTTGLAIPRGGLGFLVERVDDCQVRTARRSSGAGGGASPGGGSPSDVGVPGRLIVEVVRWAVGWHGTDGTDPTCEPAQNMFNFSTLTSLSARLGPSSCVDSATNLQLRPLALMVRESWRKLYCGLAGRDPGSGRIRTARGLVLCWPRCHQVAPQRAVKHRRRQSL